MGTGKEELDSDGRTWSLDASTSTHAVCTHSTLASLSSRGCPLCPVDLRPGDYRTALFGVTSVEAVICDPPYGERTHTGQTSGRDGSARRDVGETYAWWDESDVRTFTDFWAGPGPFGVPRCRGWICVMSCSDLAPVWRQAMEDAGRMTFAPVPCVMSGMTVRLSGDGPSSWSVSLNISRPRRKEFCKGWTRRGAYVGGRGNGGHIGGKPEWLMRDIIEDYSLPGWLVCDPCAGGGTTAIAARELGRKFVGSEVAADTYARALARLQGGE